MLLRCFESFAQRNFYGNNEIIFMKINQHKFNMFEGLEHSICLWNKIILHAKNHIISTNHSAKYLKVAKYYFHVLNTVALLVFANGTVKVVQ